GSGSFPTSGGGSFGGLSSTGTGAPPGTIDSVLPDAADTGAGQPVLAAMEPTAIRIDPDAYAIKWLVPLLLLLGGAFWSFVLNREIKLPRR
ncbi:MAG: hypothetical protein LC808_42920, partial [Actinobacteria bacterium]|nr:hypothetical protein [Actinomycetota bacterium]